MNAENSTDFLNSKDYDYFRDFQSILMQSLTDYIEPVLAQLTQSQVKKNIASLTNKMMSTRCSNLWTLSESSSEYTRYTRMLNGSLKNIVDSSKLNIALLAHGSS